MVEGRAGAFDAVVRDVPLVRHELPLAQVGVVAGRGQERGRIDGRLEARLAAQPYMDGFHEEGVLLVVSKPSSVHENAHAPSAERDHVPRPSSATPDHCSVVWFSPGDALRRGR